MGVPLRMTRRAVLSSFSAWNVWLCEFFSRWPWPWGDRHTQTGAGVSGHVRAPVSGRPCGAYFIAEDQADGLALEDVGVDAERLVRDDQDLGRAVLVVVRVRAGQAPAQPRLVRLDADERLPIGWRENPQRQSWR